MLSPKAAEPGDAKTLQLTVQQHGREQLPQPHSKENRKERDTCLHLRKNLQPFWWQPTYINFFHFKTLQKLNYYLKTAYRLADLIPAVTEWALSFQCHQSAGEFRQTKPYSFLCSPSTASATLSQQKSFLRTAIQNVMLKPLDKKGSTEVTLH